MTRIRKNRQPLLVEKKERIPLHRSHPCLRTECLVSAIFVGMLALFVTWGSSAVVKAGYDLVQARSCLTKIEKENELLRLEMARLKAPQRIREIAVGQLGMINPMNVYMAANDSAAGRTDNTRTKETSTAQRFFLFGDARAEAHPLR